MDRAFLEQGGELLRNNCRPTSPGERKQRNGERRVVSNFFIETKGGEWLSCHGTPISNLSRGIEEGGIY